MREVKLTIDDLTNERPGGPHRFILHYEFVFTLQDFVALLWSEQACLRFKGDGTFPSAPKRQQAAALQRAQWGVILLSVAARLLRGIRGQQNRHEFHEKRDYLPLRGRSYLQCSSVLHGRSPLLLCSQAPLRPFTT